MPLSEAVKYVASAYAVIIVVFIAYLVVAGRRIGRLQREVQVLDDELTRRGGGPADSRGVAAAWNTPRSSPSGSPSCSTRPASCTSSTS